MSYELIDAIDGGNASDQIGAFVFTGAGRGFCAGADVGDEFSGEADPVENDDRPERRNWVDLVRESKPMVAAINGPAVGVGLTMILPMDYLVASESSRLSARFVKMGIVPELASSHYLVQRCGWGAANDLALSGRIVSGPEGKELGLVDRVVSDVALLDTAFEHANSYAVNSPTAVSMIKELLTLNGSESDLAAVQRRELQHLKVAMRSVEHKEAVSAFLEKREPKFR
jgi:2-(1,2-epoxy-1,2-dihydrophenyl)acetyl-CoA isomerase